MTVGQFPPSGIGTRKGGGSGVAGAGFAGGSGVPAPAAAGITLVGVSTLATITGSNGSSLATSWPAGYSAVDNDLALIHISGNLSNVPPSMTTPTGWTRLTVNPGYNGATGGFSWVFYRKLVAGDAAPALVSPAGASDLPGGYGATISVWRGVNTSTPFDATTVLSGSAESGSPKTPTGITTVTANAVVVNVICSGFNSTDVAVSVANGYSTGYSGAAYKTTTASDWATAMTHKVVAAAGATTCATYTGGGNWGYCTLALRPA